MIGDFDDVLARLKSKLPSRWFGGTGDALPIFDGVLAGIASLLSFVYTLYAYAKLQTRIMTATDGWLDMIAADFFGPDQVRRATGQGDASYRLVILANLFREKATRNAIVSILTSLTGRAPTIIEPTRPADTGAYGNNRRASLVGATIFRTDWQGHQQLSSSPRSNLRTFSEDFSNAVWTRTAGLSSVNTNVIASPDGSMTADQLIVTTSGVLTTASAAVVATSTTMNYSIFTKKGNRSTGVFNLRNATTATNFSAVFNYDTGVITGAGWSATPYPDGWFELSITQSSGISIGDSLNCYWGAFGASVLVGDNWYVWGAMLSAEGGAYIRTAAIPVTISDYILPGSGIISLGQPPVVGAVLSVVSPQDGIATERTFGIGDGTTTAFTVSVPTGPYAPIGYGVAGSYGSLVLPYQAFVIAYRPVSNAGIASVAGYGTSSGGYSTPSWAEYASMDMVTGGVTDADIFAAIDAVKPAGTIVWTRISN